MHPSDPYSDGFERLLQAGSAGVRLVRLTAAGDDNTYTARAIEFDPAGVTQVSSAEEWTVTNLAEAPGEPGQIEEGTDAVAIDVEGRWVVHVRPVESGVFAARVLSSSGSASYVVREQVAQSGGTLVDRPGAIDVTARNLAEMNLGPGGALDAGEVVLVKAVRGDGDPPVVQYVFDHPTYAKYLD